ncbi:MAG: ABC transporter permease [Bacteroidales bacterium]|nr:ABC transporter permease [Bacteroidales bacterium]
MNKLSVDFRLARQLLSNRGGSYSRPIVKLSLVGIALGMVIMIISLAVTAGYRDVLSRKIVDMGAHVRISNLAINYSFEPVPFDRNQPFVEPLSLRPEVKGLHFYYTKVGIVKTADQVEGVVLKGVETNFFTDGFASSIIEGKTPDLNDEKPSNQIVISKYLSKKLQLSVGDKARLYFVQDPPKQRSFEVCAIYETSLPEYDESFALVDLRQVQKLNEDANFEKVGGIEVMLNDFDKTEEIAQYANMVVGTNLKAEPIQQIYHQLFTWMDMFSANVWVLLIITAIVCLVTMISTFFIIVLEQIPTIGILKTMGLNNVRIRRVFVIVAANIILKGMVIGNAIALVFCFVQDKFHLIKLSAEAYYVDFVPVLVQGYTVLMVNGAVLLLCLLAVLLPANVVARKIVPAKAVRFE